MVIPDFQVKLERGDPEELLGPPDRLDLLAKEVYLAAAVFLEMMARLVQGEVPVREVMLERLVTKDLRVILDVPELVDCLV